MTPELVAALIIREGKLFLVHNTKHGSRRIEPPGGKVREGEAREAAVKREVYEEAGLTVDGLTYFGAYGTSSPEGNFTVYMYICGRAEGEPVVREPDKISSFGWYGVEGLEALKEEGTLVPNICESLDRLKGLLR